MGLLCGFCPSNTALELNVCVACERDSSGTMILQIVLAVVALLILFLTLFLLGWRHIYGGNPVHRTYDMLQGLLSAQLTRVASIFNRKDPAVKWKDVGTVEPQTGAEIQNQALAVALKQKRQLTQNEMVDFKLHDLSHESYIKVGNTYFRLDKKEQNVQSDPATQRRFIQAAKIFFAYYQVISGFIVFKVRLPDILETSIKYLHAIGKILSLDVFEYPGLGCLVGMPWFQRLIIRTLTPIIILILMAAPVAVSYWRLRSLGPVQAGYMSPREMQRKRLSVRLTHEDTYNTFWTVSLSWIFLVFPSMTLASMEAFSCQQIGRQKYLSADLEELCPSPSDGAYWFSIIMTGFWATGTPVFILWTMIYHKVPKMADLKIRQCAVNLMIHRYLTDSVDPSCRKFAMSIGRRIGSASEDTDLPRRIVDLYGTIFLECNGHALPKLSSAVLKRALSFREASGLTWINVGTHPPEGGTELDHKRLSEALSQKTTFTAPEWKSLRITDLHMNHFIKSEDYYYKPACCVSEIRLTIAHLKSAIRKWFEDIDINVNSFLDEAELQLEFEGLGRGVAEAGSILTFFDTDENGHLDSEEFEIGMLHILDSSIPGISSSDLVALFVSFPEIISNSPISLERFSEYGRKVCAEGSVFTGAEHAETASVQQLLALLNYKWPRRSMEAGDAGDVEVDMKMEADVQMDMNADSKPDIDKPLENVQAIYCDIKPYEPMVLQCKLLSQKIGLTLTSIDIDNVTVFDLPNLLDQILMAFDNLLPASLMEDAADRETANIVKLRNQVKKCKDDFRTMLLNDVEKLGLKLAEEGVIMPPPLEWDGSLGIHEVKVIERLGFLLDAYQVSVWYWEVRTLPMGVVLCSTFLGVLYSWDSNRLFVYFEMWMNVHDCEKVYGCKSINKPRCSWYHKRSDDQVISACPFLMKPYVLTQNQNEKTQPVEMIRKLILSSLLVVIYNGSAPQMVGSLLTTFIFLLAHLQVLGVPKKWNFF